MPLPRRVMVATHIVFSVKEFGRVIHFLEWSFPADSNMFFTPRIGTAKKRLA
jgi:hypothetical protein